MYTHIGKTMAINISEIDQFQIATYTERQFKPAWYALCEVWGNAVQSASGVEWKGSKKWDELRTQMTTMFGSPENPRVSTEVLVQFSLQYFNKGLEDLIAINRQSFKRRQQYKNAA